LFITCPFINHRHRQGESIRHAVTTEAGKAAEIRRLATYQSSIK